MRKAIYREEPVTRRQNTRVCNGARKMGPFLQVGKVEGHGKPLHGLLLFRDRGGKVIVVGRKEEVQRSNKR